MAESDVADLLEQAAGQPYEIQVPLLEEAQRLADALGREDLQGTIRLQLMRAYVFSNSGPKMFTPFNWLLQRYRERPDWFDESMRYHFLWSFKWATSDLQQHPEVPLPQIEGALASMYETYADAGEGPAPAHGCAFTLARHVHGLDGAEDAYERWVASERTRLSDCIACEPSRRAGYRAEQGRWQDALDLIFPALNSGKTCESQPAGLYAEAIEPLLRTGRAEEAVLAQRRGWRLTREAATQLWNVSTHLGVLARSGQLERGMDILAARIDDVDSAATPVRRMMLAASAARLLDAVAAEPGGDARTITRGGRESSIDEVRSDLRRFALDLAGRFDARNGTGEQSRLIHGILESTGLPALPFPAPMPPPAASPQRHPLAPALGDLAAQPPQRLAALIEPLQRYAPVEDVATLGAEWRSRRGGLESLRAGADADGLRALAELEYLAAWSQPAISAERAAPFLDSAAALFRASGDEAAALLVEQWLLARSGRNDEALALIEAVDAAGDDAQRAGARMRCVPGVDADRGRSLLSEVRALPCAVDSPPLLRRAWASAQEYGASSGEEGYEQAARGLAMLLPGEYADLAASLHCELAWACDQLGRPDEAEAELDAAERLARAHGGTVPAGVVILRARRALAADDPAAAEPLLAEAAALAEPAQSWAVYADAQGILTETYRSAGRILEAAEVVERALAVLQAAQAADAHWDGGMDVRLARLTELAALLCADLDERSRAAGLYRRAAELWEAAGDQRAASICWSGHARLVADTLESVRGYRRALALAGSADDQREAMITARALPFAVLEADGLVAALHELDAAVALLDRNENRRLTDPEFVERLGAWDFEAERLDHVYQRARLYSLAERYEDALAVLGDVADRMDAHGADGMAADTRLFEGRVLIAMGRVDEGLVPLEAAIATLRSWGDRDATIADIAGIGARALADAGRTEDADAFWARHTAPAGTAQ